MSQQPNQVTPIQQGQPMFNPQQSQFQGQQFQQQQFQQQQQQQQIQQQQGQQFSGLNQQVNNQRGIQIQGIQGPQIPQNPIMNSFLQQQVQIQPMNFASIPDHLTNDQKNQLKAQQTRVMQGYQRIQQIQASNQPVPPQLIQSVNRDQGDYHMLLRQFQKDYQKKVRREHLVQSQKYKREDILESYENNMEFGGCYPSCLYRCGVVCGTLRTVCPCIFCLCIDYPFRQIETGQEAIYERLGKYVKTVGSGLQEINPCTDVLHVYSTKLQSYDLSKQWAITKDNILVSVDCVVYYKIVIARKAHYFVDSITGSVAELTFSTVRQIVGQYTLQDLLEKRQDVTDKIQDFIETYLYDWGVEITDVKFKDITINEELKNSLNLPAKERRLAESKIISAKADVQAAKLMREAADILDSNASMQIRYLETIAKLGTTSKVIFMGDEESQ